MEAKALHEWFDPSNPPLDSLVSHRFLEPPYGYALGIVVWPVYLAIWYTTVFAAETLGLVPFSLSVIVAFGGLLVTSTVSVVAVSITAWKVPYARIRGQSLALSLCLVLGFGLGYVYFWSPPVVPSPYSVLAPLGLGVFVEHAMITTGVLGLGIGFAFLTFALLVFGFRYRLETTA